MCKHFSPQHFDKGIAHLRGFMSIYSNSFQSHDDKILYKLKRRKQKCLKYFRHLLFYLHNDASLHEHYERSTENINLILDNYITEVADRFGEYYFSSYS